MILSWNHTKVTKPAKCKTPYKELTYDFKHYNAIKKQV